MPAWLKAGLIGMGGLVVLTLLGFYPLLNCITKPLSYFVYVIIGVLAAVFLPVPRLPRSAAGHGAMANLLAGVINGIVSILGNVIGYKFLNWATLFPQLDFDNTIIFPVPWLIEPLMRAGISLELFRGLNGVIIWSIVLTFFIILVAIVLGAFGAAIYAEFRPE